MGLLYAELPLPKPDHEFLKLLWTLGEKPIFKKHFTYPLGQKQGYRARGEKGNRTASSIIFGRVCCKKVL
ncbi:hypothetical protein EBS57_08255 [bacterium]|nr:hypothetical protein [bacterium]